MPGEGLGGNVSERAKRVLFGSSFEEERPRVVAVGDFILDKIVPVGGRDTEVWGEEDWFPPAGGTVMVDERPEGAEGAVESVSPGGGVRIRLLRLLVLGPVPSFFRVLGMMRSFLRCWRGAGLILRMWSGMMSA